MILIYPFYRRRIGVSNRLRVFNHLFKMQSFVYRANTYWVASWESWCLEWRFVHVNSWLVLLLNMHAPCGETLKSHASPVKGSLEQWLWVGALESVLQPCLPHSLLCDQELVPQQFLSSVFTPVKWEWYYSLWRAVMKWCAKCSLGSLVPGRFSFPLWISDWVDLEPKQMPTVVTRTKE